MIDVTALGELLIDFTPAGRSQQGNPLFEQNPGGAPANVLAAVTRLGKKAALISAVGSDQFGRALTEVIEGLGIDPSGIQVKEDAFTTLAFVHLNAAGDRSFSFARKPGADQCIETDAIDHALIDRCRIFHFGSVSLSAEPACSTTLDAARYAFEHGKLVSYDPNWRPTLWNSTEQGIAGMKLGLPYTNILKLSEEELELLSGTADPEEGTKKLFCGAMKLIVVRSGRVTVFTAAAAKRAHIRPIRQRLSTQPEQATPSGGRCSAAFLISRPAWKGTARPLPTRSISQMRPARFAPPGAAPSRLSPQTNRLPRCVFSPRFLKKSLGKKLSGFLKKSLGKKL